VAPRNFTQFETDKKVMHFYSLIPTTIFPEKGVILKKCIFVANPIDYATAS
jgi:hypothetical protein